MSETKLWLVYSQNGMHGTRRLINSGLSEDAANKLRDSFRDNKQNPEHYHKADYFTLGYIKGTRNAVMAEHKIEP